MEKTAVFVSYASQDTALANAIVGTLEEHGLRCWVAPRDVTSGSHYADGIMKASSGAKLVVLILSDSALASRHVGKEVERASSKGRPIIVLPFVNMSEDRNNEYFSDGLSEELIDMLTKIPALRVPARTSSFYFKGKQATVAEIARALGVSHVLEGSVRKSGNKLRITARLIRADNGYHV
jgi:TolB-like protein